MSRTPGAKNVVGTQAKENVIAVFTRLGGTAAMAKWAESNPNEFYRIYAKLVPQETNVKADVDANLTVEILRFADSSS